MAVMECAPCGNAKWFVYNILHVGLATLGVNKAPNTNLILIHVKLVFDSGPKGLYTNLT